jgi:glutathione S-transferase
MGMPIELYQTEWCPHSSRVRQRLTELGVSFVARQVPAERADREELRRKTGSEEIPTLLLEDGTAISGADEIIEYLEAKHHERADAEEHRERAEAHS